MPVRPQCSESISVLCTSNSFSLFSTSFFCQGPGVDASIRVMHHTSVELLVTILMCLLP